MTRTTGAAGKPQKGFNQLAHFICCMLDTLELHALAGGRGQGFEQQLACAGDDHQGGAQLVANIAGEQALPVECLA
ncbi:hypothetical protein SDC9_210845 [bioreactor metagenome]|uniref:Uncharacterized protein n=1 Tax=bioreactor metagenome TaxID=1076179 RepID=A0A645JHJ3_9ZZZZ